MDFSQGIWCRRAGRLKKENRAMVRSKWKKALMTSVAWAGVALSQVSVARSGDAVPTVGSIITVQEPGKVGQKCRIVRAWTRPDGTRGYEAHSLATGEKMTIIEG